MLQDENDWLREELEDTERRLEEATSKLAVIQEEKKQWLFMEQVSNSHRKGTDKCLGVAGSLGDIFATNSYIATLNT